MKKIMMGVVAIIILISGFLLWQQYKQDKAFMGSLFIHKPIEISQINSIHLWVKEREIKKSTNEEDFKVVQWFNEYPPERVSEAKVPKSDAQVIIKLQNPNGTISINYMRNDKKIYVSKSGPIGPQYVFLDDAPELENFFEELIDKS
ncbi:MAG TPA: hypothetical protein VJ824_12405 [Bacillota bacterium]|nr:hypothetical protein [Bacillota bacterium]